MEIVKTPIQGLVIIKPTIFQDQRGFFYESYQEAQYRKHGITSRFIQDNISKSCKGVIRGLHYQLNPYSQAKLISVLKGKIIDIAVDLRKNSPTFGQSFSIELSAENKLQVFIPHGFAHGFSVLSDEVLFSYKCDNVYSKQHERGIRFNDSSLNLKWGLNSNEIKVSEKDQILPPLDKAEINFNISDND